MVLLLNNVKHFPCIIHNLQMFVYETISNILKSIICNALKNSHVSISKLYFLKRKPTWLQSPRTKTSHYSFKIDYDHGFKFDRDVFFCICLVIYSIWYVYIFHCFKTIFLNLLILSIFYIRPLKKIP